MLIIFWIKFLLGNNLVGNCQTCACFRFYTNLFDWYVYYQVRDRVLQILHRVLSPKVYRQNVLSSRTPYSLTKNTSRTRNRHQLINPKRNRLAALNRSDCEDNSSGEEEFAQVLFSKIIFYVCWIFFILGKNCSRVLHIIQHKRSRHVISIH